MIGNRFRVFSICRAPSTREASSTRLPVWIHLHTYLFRPYLLGSTLSFSAVIKQAVTDNADTDNKGIYLFWNMVDGREKTPLYAMYEKSLAELGLPILRRSPTRPLQKGDHG
ncbi:hypothetical protein ACS6XI_08320 [Porphyromonas endodontalis]|uniref:hypothetical protein n=1 Tax=Porphyromonas endodontalis TaxID=28124 RepID=UPI003FA6A75B